jgi:hypothetical protein
MESQAEQGEAAPAGPRVASRSEAGKRVDGASVGFAVWWVMGKLAEYGWTIRVVQIASTGTAYLTATQHQHRLTLRVADHRTTKESWFKVERRTKIKLQLLAHRPTSFEHVDIWLRKLARKAGNTTPFSAAGP